MSRATRTNHYSRRGLLTAMAGAGLALPLAGCGSGGGSDRPLRAAFPTAGTRDSLDPHTSSLFVEQARSKALFDTLVGYADDMSVLPRLAHRWEPDETGTRWSIRLREARFHDNRPVTAQDVLYSYRRIADPRTTSPSRSLFANVDFTASRVRSSHELELVLHVPDFEFPLAWGAPATEIVPAGMTRFTAPVGSGPFRYESFEPGASAVFARFDGYWEGPPIPRRLEFVPIDEENARVTAVLSGQVDYAHDVSASSARLVRRDSRTRVVAAPHGTMQAVVFKVDRAPFDDPRLVQAMRYGIDRAELVEIALGGQGDIGNDLFGKGLEYYPNDLAPISRDVDRARALVRRAQADSLSFDLHTSSIDPYFESAASLLAEQLGELGLRVNPRTGPSETYFTDIKQRGVAALTRTAALPLPTFLRQRLHSDAGSDNYTNYRSRECDRLLDLARRTKDDATRARLLGDAQRLSRVDSGMVVWGFSNWNDAVSSDLTGLRAAPPNSLDWARFDRASLR